MAKVSTEAKNRWNANNYKRYTVNLRKEDDAEIIQFIEKQQAQDKKIITTIFRAGYDHIKKEGF